MSTPRLTALASLAALLTASPAFALSDPSSVRVAPYRQLLMQQLGTPEALLTLHRLYALKSQVEELGPLADVFADVANTRRALPEVAALARMFQADVERARGKLEVAQTTVNRLGMLSHFQVIGAFDNEGKAHCDQAYPPETAVDLAARYPGKAREVGWRKFEISAPDGFMDLTTAVRPIHEAVIYAATDLEVAKDTRAMFHLGASGANKLFVDGQRVLEDKQYHPAVMDQEAVAVTLRKGSHRLLLKVCEDDSAVGFYMRATGLRGEALAGVTSHAPEKPIVPPHGSLQPEVQASPLDWFEKRAKTNAQTRADLAEALVDLRTYDTKDHRPREESSKAAQGAADSATIQMLASRLEDQDPNARRAYLEQADAASKGAPQPELELAKDDLSRGHPDRAFERLHALLSRPGPSVESVVLGRIDPATAEMDRVDPIEAQLLMARAEEELGNFSASVQRVQALLRANPRSLMVLREAVRQDRRLDRAQDTLGSLRVILALRYDDLDARRGLILELINEGKVDDALDEMDRLLALDPTDLSTLTHKAELLAHNGKGDRAKAIFRAAEQLSPEEAETYEREGKALLSLGDGAEAQRAFEASLKLRPQQPHLKDALRLLRGEQQNSGEQYAADARAVIAAHPPKTSEDTEVLSDLEAVKVFENGLSSRYVQLIARANSERGVDALRSHYVNYSPDRQEVSIVRTRTWRPDGTITEAHAEGDQNLSEPWAGIYYDARMRVVTFPNLQPGDVVELVYRVDDAARDNLLSDYFGDLVDLQADSPKARMTYVLQAPKGRPIYANQPRLAPTAKSEEAQADGTVVYRWSWDNVPKVVAEPHMPGYGEASATLHVSTYKDWASVGQFYWGLVRDQLVASDEVKKTAAELGQGIAAGDDAAKVRAVYDFVVSKTRYVGLEFGIHGYKPYAVDRILNRRFGDCKDKASLMHALLEQLNVPSNLVLLRMKHLGDVDPEPASLAIFNHAILYVPKLDTYLDGTAEYFGSAELPSEDRGAMVLVVQPQGQSQIGKIPEGKAEANATDTTYEIDLKRDGAARVTAESVVTGLNAPEYRQAYSTAATRRSVFEQAWSRTFPGLTVEKVDVGDVDALEQPVKLSFALGVPHYADLETGGLIFSPFGRARSYVESYAPLSERHFDVVVGYPWRNKFVYRYRLPEGMTAQDLPKSANEDTPFGSIHLNYEKKGEVLECAGEISLSVPRVAVADYPKFRTFLGDIDQALGRKVELVAPLKLPPTGEAGAPQVTTAQNP